MSLKPQFFGVLNLKTNFYIIILLLELLVNNLPINLKLIQTKDNQTLLFLNIFDHYQKLKDK